MILVEMLPEECTLRAHMSRGPTFSCPGNRMRTECDVEEVVARETRTQQYAQQLKNLLRILPFKTLWSMTKQPTLTEEYS